MAKFRVVIVKKDGRPIGVSAAQINGRIIYLALRDELEPMNWYDAVKVGVQTKEEWMAIAENFNDVSRELVRAGGEPLKRDWYWSSSEYSSFDAWGAYLGNSLLDGNDKFDTSYVRPVLAL